MAAYQRLFSWLRVVIGLGLTIWLLSRVDYGRLWAVVGEGSPTALVAGFVAFGVAYCLVQVGRLHTLVRHYTGGFSGTSTLFYVGMFFNNFLPAATGGDAARLVLLKRLGGEGWSKPFTYLLIHRVTGIVFLLLAGGAYAVFRWNELVRRVEGQGVSLSSGVVWGAVAAGIVVAGGIAAWPKGRRKLFRFASDCWGAARELSAGSYSALSVLTVGYHALRGVALYYFVAFLGDSVEPVDLVFVLAATAVVAVLPISIGGLGVVEGAIAGGLVMFGVGADAALGTALLNRTGLLVLSVIGGVTYARLRSSDGPIETAKPHAAGS